MSTPVMLVTSPVAVPAADLASAPASGTPENPFSRVLADQRRTDAAPTTPTMSPRAGTVADKANERHPDDPTSLGTERIKTDAADSEPAHDDDDDTLRLAVSDPGTPEAPLAVLTLDIAAQVQAQLRGARARATQTDAATINPSDTTDTSNISDANETTDVARRVLTPRHNVTPGEAAQRQRASRLPGAAQPADDTSVLRPQSALSTDVPDASGASTSRPLSDPSPSLQPSLLQPLSPALPRRAQTSVSTEPNRRAVAHTGKPSASTPEHTALTGLRAKFELPREAVTASGAPATTSSPHELSLAQLAPHQPEPPVAPAPLSSTHARAMPTTPLHVEVPVGAPQWGSALGRQLVTLGRQHQDGTQTAELRLDPPELGPLRVTLTVSEGVAQAAFSSPHASVRQAVEAAMSQLQSALAQSGISLGQANVSDQQAPGEFAQQFAQQSGRVHVPTPHATASTEAPASAATQRSDALVDTFA